MNQSQIKFALAAHATWLVLRNPVLTNVYLDKWQSLKYRPTTKDGQVLTLYGFIFQEMYEAAKASRSASPTLLAAKDCILRQFASIK